MRVALDTNRYVDLCKGVGETVALLEEAEAIMLPFVVLGELRAGFAHGRRQSEIGRMLMTFEGFTLNAIVEDTIEVSARQPRRSRYPDARRWERQHAR